MRSDRRIATLALTAVIAVGVGLRLFHYARCPAVWHDEAAMIVNVLNLPAERLLGPLLLDEAAPPLFLAVEKVAVAAFGDGEFALRLIPVLTACASVFAMALLARRLLPPWWSVLATALFAASDRLLWHACEVKSYSIDLLLAAAAAYFVVATERWPLARRAVVAAVLAPPLLWLSYPAAFLFGGVILALLPQVRTAKAAGRIGYLALILAVGLSFLALVVGPAAAQRTAAMDSCWVGAFPDWSQPWWVPVWAVANTFEVFRYCFMPIGQPLLIPVVVGTWAVARGPHGFSRMAVLVGPLLLAFLASLVGKYPYAAARVMVFVCPALCVLVAAGLAVLHERLQGYRGWRVALPFWLACCAVPIGFGVRTVVWPWPRAACDEATRFVLDHRRAGEPIYANHWEYEYYLRHVEPDFVRVHHDFSDGPHWDEWVNRFAARPAAKRPRLWVIHTQQSPPVTTFSYQLPTGYRIDREAEFRFTRVSELVPTADPESPQTNPKK